MVSCLASDVFACDARDGFASVVTLEADQDDMVATLMARGGWAYVADLSRQPVLARSNLFLLVDEPNARLAVDSLAAHSQVAW